MRERGLRGECGRVVVRTQDREESSHLAQRLRCRPLDRVDRASRVVGILRQRVPGAARLEHDHADRVRDDVVQLARDPRALLGASEARTLVAFANEQPLAFAADSYDDAGEERTADQEAEEQEAAHVQTAAVLDRDDHDRAEREQGCRNERAALGVCPSRIQRHHHHQGQRHRVVVLDAVEGRCRLEPRNLEEEGEDGGAQPQEENRGHAEPDQREGMAVGGPLPVEPQLDLSEHPEPEHEDELTVGPQQAPDHKRTLTQRSRAVVARAADRRVAPESD